MKKDEIENPIRQLIKFSNYSLCITLPKDYIDNLGWQQGDRISFELAKDTNNLILKKQPSQPQTNQQDQQILEKSEKILLTQELSEDLNINLDNLEPIPQIN